MVKKLFAMMLGLVLGLQVVQANNPPAPVRPDEGMWLPLLIQTLNYKDMQSLGCKLTPEQIYSVNNASIKDAIVQLGGFCTAEVVSPQGLLLTNHHCGFDAIQSHSSVEHDYLTNGFWAMTKAEELPIEGLSVSFLERVENVTEKMNAAIAAEGDREAAIEMETGKMEEAASEGGKYRAEVKPMFASNEFYLFVYKVYRDIRLVGAPPSAVGKFGGDTDNWMWPRHTGDFSMMRIYAGEDNEPADYSASNKPYSPKHYLPVTVKGVKEGDFAFIMGYPGSTDRYQTSYSVKQAFDNDNRDIIKLLGNRLSLMKEDMDRSDEVRIKLASDYASLSNSWKYYEGQELGLSRRDLVSEKAAAEAKFTSWVNADASRKAEYGEVLPGIKAAVESNVDVAKLSNYINMAAFGPAIVSGGVPYWRLMNTMEKFPDDKTKWQPIIDNLLSGLDARFKDYNKPTDQKIFGAMNRAFYTDIKPEWHPSIYSDKGFTKQKAKGNLDRFDKYAAYVYGSTILADKAKAKAFLANPSLKALKADPGVKHVASIIELYLTKLQQGQAVYSMTYDGLMQKYLKGMREMDASKVRYPDANFTMRLTYGTIMPYVPRDGVHYDWYTTQKGILEKEIPGDEEFDVPAKLKDLMVRKDFGRYADKKTGDLVTCFLSNTDITGGNSGSPIMNAEGQLIGLAFDGNWESMISDIVFEKKTCRTISVDIRYVLFVIDKYAGAKHLVDEMNVVE